MVLPLRSAFFALALGADPLRAGEWGQVKSWVYQLTGYREGRLTDLAAAPFDLAVIDLSRDGGADFFSREEISALQSSGKIVLAYFEIGALETYRPEWSRVPRDLLAGKVDGWPDEQYVKFWDERWWPIVQGRVDLALAAGFDGAYLDLVTAYEEIPAPGLPAEERARRMVDLIVRVSRYAKSRAPGFKIVPQNAPELATWSYWEPAPNRKYLDAIDGFALESVFFLAHDKPADKKWCQENRDNALAILQAGKLVLGVDYARKPANVADACRRQRDLGFVPYVSVEPLDGIHAEGSGVSTDSAGRPRRKPVSSPR